MFGIGDIVKDKYSGDKYIVIAIYPGKKLLLLSDLNTQEKFRAFSDSLVSLDDDSSYEQKDDDSKYKQKTQISKVNNLFERKFLADPEEGASSPGPSYSLFDDKSLF